MAEHNLPLIGGRPARVALLVYNDAHNDSRVLKTAASLRSAGAQVRIFAVARARAGYAEGRGLVGGSIEVDRAPEFELARYAPWALKIARQITGRPVPMAVAGSASTAPASASSQPERETGPVVASIPGPPWVADLWLRTYRTVALSLFWVKAAQAAAAWAPDVVHANDGNTLAPARWVARRTGARIVYDSHELWRHRNVRPDRPVARVVEAAIERRGIAAAAGVITVSPSIAAWLQSTYDLPKRPSLVRNIPRSSGDDADPPRDFAGRLHDMVDLAPSAQVVAYGGRITTSRGIEETLQALALLPVSVHFVLLGYGEPDYLATLHTRIEQLGLRPRVHFVGAVAPEQVAATLADADLAVVFVRPVCLSYEFSLPNKLFEAIHAGLPIVAADLPDTAALVREHGVGEVFDLDHPAELAATMTRVLAAPQVYRDAARTAAAELTWQHEEQALRGLYAEVLMQ